MSSLAPFTKEQSDYVFKSLDCWLNVIEGGKRGSKNIVNTQAFGIFIDGHKDNLFLVGGYSVASAKLNVIDSNGLGLTYYFKGRCKEGKYKDRDCLRVYTRQGEKIILISGGGKKGDEKLIQGNTYGGVLITEANLCCEEFVNETFDRTMSSSNRKIFHDLNPKPPKHWYYEKILNVHENKQKADIKYGFNYLHTNILDNMSLSNQQIKTILNTYDKNSIWYKRDILGIRTNAEGGVFLQFSNNPKRWIIDKPSKYSVLFVGVDYGGNISKTVFTLSGLCVNDKGQPEIHILESHKVVEKGKPIDSNQISSEHKEFFMNAFKKYGIYPTSSFTDHNMKALTTQLGKDIGDMSKVQFVDKSLGLAEWCMYLNACFNLDKIKIMSHCKNVIDSFAGLLYDSKADEDIPLDDGKTCDIDTYDSVRYSISKIIRQWILYKYI